MRTLEELIDHDNSAMPLVRQWLAESRRTSELLAPSADRDDVLVDLQVTTRSTMGAISHDSGGILIDHGWLRILGSGHPKLPRNIAKWNVGRSSGHLLFADDVVGGFFSVNGGGLGDDLGSVHYLAPDTLRWEALGLGYTDFVCWALSDRLTDFYEDLRWAGWEADVMQAKGDQCFNFYPFLWTKQGAVGSSSRKLIDVAEQYAFNVEHASRA